MMKVNDVVNREEFGQVVAEIKEIISRGILSAYTVVNSASILTYWSVGKRIVEQECCGKTRAEYGKHLISVLADELSHEFGDSFSARNLHSFRKFYLLFPDVKIVNACVHNLTWTHFRSLLRDLYER